MRLLGVVVVVGLAGSLVGCGPKEEDSAAKRDKTVQAETKTSHKTGEQGTAEGGKTKPGGEPDVPVHPPGVEAPAVDSPAVDPVPKTPPPPMPPETSPPPVGPEKGTSGTQGGEPAGPGKEAVEGKPVGGRAINLKIGDSGKTVSAGVGDLVIIELDANPTTGYSWQSEPAVGDGILDLKGKVFQTLAQLNPEIKPAVGQGGVTTFTYRVAKPGKAAISLAYRRPWEKDAEPAKTFGVQIEATKKTGPAVTGKIVFSEPPDLEKISRIVVSIRNTALADGPAPLVGTVELTPPFKLPVTFAVPYDPATVQPNPMFYSISALVYTMVDDSEKLYYINDTRHEVFRDANDTKCDVTVKKVR